MKPEKVSRAMSCRRTDEGVGCHCQPSDVSCQGPKFTVTMSESKRLCCHSHQPVRCHTWPLSSGCSLRHQSRLSPLDSLCSVYHRGGWTLAVLDSTLGRSGSEAWRFSKLNSCIKKSWKNNCPPPQDWGRKQMQGRPTLRKSSR